MKYSINICKHSVKKYNTTQKFLLSVFQILYSYYGPQHWWPGETIDEIIIGAVLTQNTSWKNVEKSINNLKKNNLLSLEKILNTPPEDIKKYIKPSGFFNQKTTYLKAIAEFIVKNKNITPDRKDLLSIKGIGEETADSILLYAYNIPTFVIDSYTKRMFQRLGITHLKTYKDWQLFFHQNLPEDPFLFNEYHALIVAHSKKHCLKTPFCTNCPLNK